MFGTYFEGPHAQKVERFGEGGQYIVHLLFGYFFEICTSKKLVAGTEK